ncbi:hypothetical protein PFICI_05466 [Pestalotiopsis fici W106-1]|uniref:Nephrocystin 3-like N-terminal domain-containing protein n=1 Tax=Pestalotiopsis fici (strain W106-1 / CGMCC3.15140) TaxID=1229662 RepID=W3XC16_PESFW|nr:uncharacterized protein PFICI_05466 [Pestalotiopsis fici W106-1]ETS83590.1 hypothetical protein PFICI_05466 [Pestalotiopsis fici W106-1]
MGKTWDQLFTKTPKSSKHETKEDYDSKSRGPRVLYDGTGGYSSGRVDIIFVHGLRGSARKTWSKGNICWPRDLLKDDIRSARVITWGYDADVAHFFSNASQESIFGHADTLLGDLARLRQDITRPIVFVAHSLGGLIVKAALIKSAEYKSHNRHPRQAEIYASTCGVAFFGTPHRGSSTEGYAEIIAGIAKLAWRRPNKSLLDALKENSQILEHQRESWTTISNNIPVVCVREELPTAIGMIVPEASASYDGYNVLRSSINANHIDMVKFGARDDPMYERVAGLLIDLVTPSLTAEEVQESSLLTDHMKWQVQHLSFAEIDDRESDIDDAYESTFEWIASNATIVTEAHNLTFATWIDSSYQGLFISGKAASGKSTLMKYLKETQETSIKASQWASDSPPIVFATYFFYEQGSDLQKSREGMLRSLISQILHQVPMRLFESDCKRSWRKLKSILRKAISDLEARGTKLFLFLDGLDEFRLIEQIGEYTDEQKDLIYDGGDNDAAWGFSEWIADGYREISTFVLELCSRKNVKICFSCRELTVFEESFQELPRLQVHVHTWNDIYRYSHGRLSQETHGLCEIERLATTIAQKASGVFLWVRLVVDRLINDNFNGNRPEELLCALDKFPSRLGDKKGLYMSMLRNIVKSDRFESARLFVLVASVQVPLHLLHLSFAAQSLEKIQANGFGSCIQVNETESTSSAGIYRTYQRRLQSRCGGFLVADPYVNFMHQTAKQFIERPSTWNSVFGDQGDFELVSCSSALIEGFITLNDVVDRLLRTRAFDVQRGRREALVSAIDLLNHVHHLDRYSRDPMAYASLVDRMNERRSVLQIFGKNEGMESFHPTICEPPRMAWFTAFESAQDYHSPTQWDFCLPDPEDFMSFAAQTDLSEYVKLKLSLKSPSQRAEEACRLWRFQSPCGEKPVFRLAYRTSYGFSFAHSYRYSISDSDIGIDMCKTLLPYMAQPDNPGTMEATRSLLPTWAHALEAGCHRFLSSPINVVSERQSTYFQDWLGLVLLMLKYGASVNTPIDISNEESSDTLVTLPSSDILLAILRQTEDISAGNTTLKHFEARLMRCLPENRKTPEVFTYL